MTPRLTRRRQPEHSPRGDRSRKSGREVPGPWENQQATPTSGARCPLGEASAPRDGIRRKNTSFSVRKCGFAWQEPARSPVRSEPDSHNPRSPSPTPAKPARNRSANDLPACRPALSRRIRRRKTPSPKGGAPTPLARAPRPRLDAPANRSSTQKRAARAIADGPSLPCAGAPTSWRAPCACRPSRPCPCARRPSPPAPWPGSRSWGRASTGRGPWSRRPSARRRPRTPRRWP